MHHKFALLPQLHTATESDYILLKVTHVEVFPNSILVNKNAEIGKADYERIDRNKITIITPCNNIRHNNILLRISVKGNHCLMISCTMIEILEWLQSTYFLQIHDSYIINKLYATFISPHIQIHLSDNIVPIGREYSDKVDSEFLASMQLNQVKSHHKKVVSSK